jgi:hypothetical protein
MRMMSENANQLMEIYRWVVQMTILKRIIARTRKRDVLGLDEWPMVF